MASPNHNTVIARLPSSHLPSSHFDLLLQLGQGGGQHHDNNSSQTQVHVHTHLNQQFTLTHKKDEEHDTPTLTRAGQSKKNAKFRMIECLGQWYPNYMYTHTVSYMFVFPISTPVHCITNEPHTYNAHQSKKNAKFRMIECLGQWYPNYTLCHTCSSSPYPLQYTA